MLLLYEAYRNGEELPCPKCKAFVKLSFFLLLQFSWQLNVTLDHCLLKYRLYTLGSDCYNKGSRY